MPPKTAADARVIIPVTCPNCGAQGGIDASRFGREFTCTKCLKIFHLEVTQAVRGKRPQVKLTQTTHRPVEDLQPGWLTRTWLKLPRSGQMGFLGGLGLLLVSVVLGYYMAPGAESLPEGLEGRAHYLGMAIVHADLNAVRAVSAPEGKYQNATWLGAVRKSTMPNRYPADQPPKIQVDIVSRTNINDKSNPYFGAAVIKLMVEVKFGAFDEQGTFVTYWVQDRDLNWWFDIKRTLDNLGRR